MIERIHHNGNELAVIIRSTFKREGIEFFTPSDYSQQLGYMKRPSGYVIAPHVHNPIPSKVPNTSEVLIVRSGRVRVDFYSIDKQYLESTVLERGDVILVGFCGHGFEMLEESELIEVRQGPYVGEQDKTRFRAISKNEVKIRKIR